MYHTAMKFFLSIIFFFFFLSNSIGQSQSLKIYSNFTYLNSSRYYVNTSRSNGNFNFEQFTLAYQKTKPNSFTEYEIGLVTFEKDETEEEYFDTHFRFQIGFQIAKLKNEKINFYISPSVKLFYLKYWRPFTSFSGDVFPSTTTLAGINPSLFLGTEIHLSDKLFFDLNTSFLGAHLGVDFTKNENPLLTENQNKQGGFDFNLLSELLLRIGIGFKF